VNRTAAGATVWQRPFWPEPTAVRRVDYIFVTGPVGANVVRASRVVLDRPRKDAEGRTIWPSDHYGVLADLNLFGSRHPLTTD
jgi:endonuclease/exonuclease/phosphatase family metal-dependent hydrolase